MGYVIAHEKEGGRRGREEREGGEGGRRGREEREGGEGGREEREGGRNGGGNVLRFLQGLLVSSGRGGPMAL